MTNTEIHSDIVSTIVSMATESWRAERGLKDCPVNEFGDRYEDMAPTDPALWTPESSWNFGSSEPDWEAMMDDGYTQDDRDRMADEAADRAWDAMDF